MDCGNPSMEKAVLQTEAGQIGQDSGSSSLTRKGNWPNALFIQPTKWQIAIEHIKCTRWMC